MATKKPRHKGKEANPEEGTYILVGGSDDDEDPHSFQADIVGTQTREAQLSFLHLWHNMPSHANIRGLKSST